ncbi:aminopeptidase P family N-terminal domain-containing protein, partial [Escherichia coli]|uniref:aminopeptidase P family N-terminal domain-containing protein n=1 Tax=Escherichia coli TaxID=562 RepID=UPI00256EF954
RGADVDYNPVFVAHALIGLDGATLYLADGKVSAELAAALARDGVTLAPYADASRALAALPADDVMLVDPRRVTYGLLEAVPEAVRVVEA